MTESPLPRLLVPLTQSTPLCALEDDEPLGYSSGPVCARRLPADPFGARPRPKLRQNNQTTVPVKTWITRKEQKSCSLSWRQTKTETPLILATWAFDGAFGPSRSGD